MPIKDFATGHLFESVKICVVIVNAVLLALYDPLGEQDAAVSVLNILVNIFYIVEFVFLIAVLGVGQYFDRPSRIIDGLISILSFIWILLVILVETRAIRIDNGSNVLAAIQLTRVIEPLLLIRLIPNLFNGIQAKTFLDLTLNVIVPFMMLLAFALISHLLVGADLQYRCVPRNLTNQHVLNNQFFQVYGEDYFYSIFNVEYCGYRVCDAGFECKNIDRSLYGVFADYNDPWLAFVSNTAFMTLRGWPNIFWAINDTSGPGYAVAIFFMVAGFGTLLVFNMFAAVFVAVLKSKRKYLERIDWLRLYPGDLNNLTELELVLWAKRNPAVIDKFTEQVREDKSLSGRLLQLYRTVTGKKQENKRENLFDAQLAGETKSDAKSKASKTTTAAAAVAATEDDEDDADHHEDLLVQHETIKLCVPSFALFRYFRKQVRDPLSRWNIGVYTLVMASVVFYAFNDIDGDQRKAQTFFIGSIVFNAIFGCELLLYIITHGPFLYFNYWTNLFDAIIILIGLFSLGLPGGCRYVNIFRMFKLVRSQPRHVKGSLLEEREYRQQLRDTDLSLPRILAVAADCVNALILYFCLVCVFVYAFAVISMRIFPGTSGRTIEPTTGIHITPLPLDTSVVLLERTFSGRFVPLFNFNNFKNAFITVFSIMERNAWYNLAVTESIRAGFSTFWFFFLWIFLSNYILLPALVAHVNVVVEKKALDLIRDVADENRKLFVRFQYYVHKTMMYKAFQVLKRNTEPPRSTMINSGVAAAEESQMERQAVGEEVPEAPYAESYLQQQWNLRKDYSLFLFAPYTWPRTYSEAVLKSARFNELVMVAIIITTVKVLDSENSTFVTPDLIVIFSIMALIVYGIEILLKWIYYGIFSFWYGYIFNPLNLLDLALFFLQLYTEVFNDYYLIPLEIIRIVKVPAVIHYIVKSRTLDLLARSVRRSVGSVITVTVLFLIVCFYFGVFGMQLYRGGFGFCSYTAYPSGRSRFETSSSFPNGCNGGTTPITVNGVVVNIPTYWEEPDDSFDNVYKATRSIFRIGLGASYAQILFSATSYTGYEEMPDRFKSSESFLFFLGMSPIMVFLRVLLAAVVYYNYYMQTVAEAMKRMGISFLARQDDVIWLEVDNALGFIEAPYIPTPPEAASNPLRRFYYDLTNHIAYKLFFLAYVITPLALLLGFYQNSYEKMEFLYYDLIFDGIFLLDFLCRSSSIPKFYTSNSAHQELIISIFLGLTVAATALYSVNLLTRQIAYIFTLVSVVLRMHRVSAAFPQIAELFHIFWQVRNAYLPLMLTLLSTVIFYAVLGNFFLKDYDLEFNLAFLERHYNFATYYNSVVLLFAVGTGNVYTEILIPLKQGSGQLTKGLIEFYFASFYLIFNFIMVSFVVMLISRYLNRNLENAVIANQQIYDFVKAWRYTVRDLKDIDKIDHSRVKKLLLRLKKPLGLRSEFPVSEMLLNRYTSKVLSMVEEKRKKEDIGADAVVQIEKARVEKARQEEHRQLMLERGRSNLLLPPTERLDDAAVATADEEVGGGEDEEEGEEDGDQLDNRIGAAHVVKKKRGCCSGCFSGSDDDSAIAATDGISAKKYSFQQILKAVHRMVLFYQQSPEDQKFEASRLIHRHRLQVMRLYLGMFMLRQHRFKDSKDLTTRGCKTQLLVQRLAPQLHREGFLKTVYSKLSYLRQNINSYGIEDFESFMIKFIRLGIKHEVHSAQLVLKKWITIKKKSSGLDAQSVIQQVVSAHRYLASLNRLNTQFDALYEQYVTRQWILDSVFVAKKFTSQRSFGPVTTLAVDFRNTIFAGFACGKVKIWRSVGTRPQIDKQSKFEQQQVLHVTTGQRVRSILEIGGGKKFFVACGKEIVQYVPKKRSRNRRKQQFREMNPRLCFHRDSINCLESYDRYLLSGGQDGIIAMWPFGTEQPCCYTTMSASVFCCAIFSVIEPNVPPDDVILTSAVAFGQANGYLYVLPLPLPKASALKASKSWKEGGLSVQVSVSGSAVSAIRYVSKWPNYLFVACADGSVTAFVIIVQRKDVLHPISMIELRPLAKSNVHASPISSLNFVGGFLFSSSHDFSLLPFNQPDRLDSKVRIEFNQDVSSGMIFHESPIVATAVNGSILVSGDDNGNVLVVAPEHISDLNLAAAAPERIRKCRFSFLEYDFGYCFVPHKNRTLEEEVTLTVTNVIHRTIGIRFLHKHDPHFRVEFIESSNLNAGCGTYKVPQSLLSSREKKGLLIPPLHCGMFRVLFTPSQPEKRCLSELEFLIDDTDLVKISVRGYGVKPNVGLDSQLRVKDFGKVAICSSNSSGAPVAARKTIELANAGKRGIVLNLFDARDNPEDKLSSLKERGFTTVPSNFYLPSQTSRSITLCCRPTKPMNVLDVPLRFNIAHATYDLCKIRSYAAGDGNKKQRQLTGAAATTATAAGAGSVLQAELQLAERALSAMRALKLSEQLCEIGVVNRLLRDIGWSIAYHYDPTEPTSANHYLCLMQPDSGLFLHLPYMSDPFTAEQLPAVTPAATSTAATAAASETAARATAAVVASSAADTAVHKILQQQQCPAYQPADAVQIAVELQPGEVWEMHLSAQRGQRLQSQLIKEMTPLSSLTNTTTSAATAAVQVNSSGGSNGATVKELITVHVSEIRRQSDEDAEKAAAAAAESAGTAKAAAVVAQQKKKQKKLKQAAASYGAHVLELRLFSPLATHDDSSSSSLSSSAATTAAAVVTAAGDTATTAVADLADAVVMKGGRKFVLKSITCINVVVGFTAVEAPMPVKLDDDHHDYSLPLLPSLLPIGYRLVPRVDVVGISKHISFLQTDVLREIPLDAAAVRNRAVAVETERLAAEKSRVKAKKDAIPMLSKTTTTSATAAAATTLNRMDSTGAGFFGSAADGVDSSAMEGTMEDNAAAAGESRALSNRGKSIMGRRPSVRVAASVRRSFHSSAAAADDSHEENTAAPKLSAAASAFTAAAASSPSHFTTGAASDNSSGEDNGVRSAEGLTECVGSVRGRVAIFQSFDLGDVINTRSTAVDPFFGSVTVAVQRFRADAAAKNVRQTHYTVTDTALVTGKNGRALVDDSGKEMSYEKSQYSAFASSDSQQSSDTTANATAVAGVATNTTAAAAPALVQFPTPQLPPDVKHGDIRRFVSITFVDESIENRAERTEKRNVYSTIVAQVHTLRHVNNRSAHRAIPSSIPKNLDNSPLPTSIYSAAGSISVEAATATTTAAGATVSTAVRSGFSAVQNYLRLGFDDEVGRGCLFGGQWNFVMDGPDLKLVSGRSHHRSNKNNSNNNSIAASDATGASVVEDNTLGGGSNATPAATTGRANSRIRVAVLKQGGDANGNALTTAAATAATDASCYLCGGCGGCAQCLGFNSRSRTKKGRVPEIVEHDEPYMDITLSAHGLTAVSSVDASFWHLHDGNVLLSSKENTLLPEEAPLKARTVVNSGGAATCVETAPLFMKALWQKVYRDQVRAMVKYSMRLQMERLSGSKRTGSKQQQQLRGFFGQLLSTGDDGNNSSDEETKQQTTLTSKERALQKEKEEFEQRKNSNSSSSGVKKGRKGVVKKQDGDQIDDDDDPANADLSAEALMRRTEGKIYKVFLELSDRHYCDKINAWSKQRLREYAAELRDSSFAAAVAAASAKSGEDKERDKERYQEVKYSYRSPDAVLNFEHLMDYLKSEDLPGYAGAFPAPLVEIALQTLQHDDKNAVSLRGFFVWFNYSESKREIEALKPRNIYGQLLEEEIGSLMKWRSKTINELAVEVEAPDLFASSSAAVAPPQQQSRGLVHQNVTLSRRKCLRSEFSEGALQHVTSHYEPVLTAAEVAAFIEQQRRNNNNSDSDDDDDDEAAAAADGGGIGDDEESKMDSTLPSLPPPPLGPAPHDKYNNNNNNSSNNNGSLSWLQNMFSFSAPVAAEKPQLPATIRFGDADEEDEESGGFGGHSDLSDSDYDNSGGGNFDDDDDNFDGGIAL